MEATPEVVPDTCLFPENREISALDSTGTGSGCMRQAESQSIRHKRHVMPNNWVAVPPQKLSTNNCVNRSGESGGICNQRVGSPPGYGRPYPTNPDVASHDAQTSRTQVQRLRNLCQSDFAVPHRSSHNQHPRATQARRGCIRSSAGMLPITHKSRFSPGE